MYRKKIESGKPGRLRRRISSIHKNCWTPQGPFCHFCGHFGREESVKVQAVWRHEKQIMQTRGWRPSYLPVSSEKVFQIRSSSPSSQVGLDKRSVPMKAFRCGMDKAQHSFCLSLGLMFLGATSRQGEEQLIQPDNL